MTVNGLLHLDAHEQPSDEMKAEWKALSRAEQSTLLADPPSLSSSSPSTSPSPSPYSIDDPHLPLEQNGFRQCGVIPRSRLIDAFAKLRPEFAASETYDDCPIIHHPFLPGLLIIPNLIPPAVQVALLDTMLHRDLSNPIHQTNLHLHYSLPYPESHTTSFFSYSSDSPPNFIPKDPSIHNPLSIKQVLQRRLHWVTLGGQYDWTNRVYPSEAAPQFPTDLSGFLLALFPFTLAQAAIVNFYSPGDTMMMHRDVSEEADKGLVSLSLGCDCLFMIAPNSPNDKDDDESKTTTTTTTTTTSESTKEQGRKHLLIRLRSGDAIYMTQESRYAWHGVPKVLKGTCPDYLAEWPAVGDVDNCEFEEWRGWMRSKRINLNVRQMKE